MDIDLPAPPDEELPPDEDSEPDWKLYERAIAHIEESYHNCTVTRNYKPVGRCSGVDRQVDVWLTANIGDNHVVTVAIECRRYSERPVSIKDIDAFCGFLDDVGANKGVMISHSGYTEGAQKRADRAGIELRTLTVKEAEEFDWEEFVRDSCESLADCFGSIDWQFSSGDSEAGYCNSCGTFHIRCGNCGWISFYDEGHIEKCSGCDMRWELKQEDGMTCAIKELVPLDDKSEDEEEEQEDV
jgi:hypothetical protein